MDYSWLSILPPIIAIVLALLTKEVISSLLIGILSGVLIYSGGNVINAVESLFVMMGDKLGGNIFIVLFLALLGVLVTLVTRAGGAKAYGEWASKKIKGRSGAMAATAGLGILIFVDDYFNCLTVGSVMRPVTDKFRISREKLAYLIDSTAAPICIIAPISSWAVSVGSTIEEAGMADGFGTFMQTIPFNFYAILTILMVFFMAFTKYDFGSMKKYEKTAVEKGVPELEAEEAEEDKKASKGKVYDLIIPIAALIIITLLAMLYTGGLFTGGASNIIEAFGNTDANTSLVWGGFAAIVIAFILYIPRKIMTFKSFMGAISAGVQSMVPAIIILTLAWTISGVCRDYLNTGGFVAHLVEASNIPAQILPAIIFIVAGALAFATGTSWGTFGILIPIVLGICTKLGDISSTLQIILISATLAGAVYGDHISPISDTTILSSTGAKCNHINHVSTQLPYATLIAVCCFVSYLVAGFAQNVLISAIVAIAFLALAMFIMKLVDKKKANA